MFGRFFTNGHQIEKELIGEANPNNTDVIGKSRFENIDVRERPFHEAKISQPEGSDPRYPKEKFAGTVHWKITEKMGIDPDELLFYTAGGGTSDLDKRGVDCWFETTLEEEVVRVTIDITINKSGKGADNPYESGEHKADIVFTVPSSGLDHKYHKEEFEEYCDGLATQVVSFLKARHESIKERHALQQTHQEIKTTRPVVTNTGGIRKWVSPETPPKKRSGDTRAA